jgi:type II secretory pathway pseudopilin PulG
MFSSPQDVRHSRAVADARCEGGFILLAVLFLVALILITLAVAAPKIAQSIRRDRELELVHRGEQYKRAVKLYYRKFQAYPSTIDQLVNTNQIRFLRKRYTDPMTGKDDWKIIHQGEQHVKIMGLFGQPIASSGGPAAAGTSIAGIGQSGIGNERAEQRRDGHIGLSLWIDGGIYKRIGRLDGRKRVWTKRLRRHVGNVHNRDVRVRLNRIKQRNGWKYQSHVWRRADCRGQDSGYQGFHQGIQAAEALQRVGVRLRPAGRAATGRGRCEFERGWERNDESYKPDKRLRRDGIWQFWNRIWNQPEPDSNAHTKSHSNAAAIKKALPEQGPSCGI